MLHQRARHIVAVSTRHYSNYNLITRPSSCLIRRTAPLLLTHSPSTASCHPVAASRHYSSSTVLSSSASASPSSLSSSSSSSSIPSSSSHESAVVSQLDALLNSEERVDITAFDRTLNILAQERDPLGAAVVWSMLESVQPKMAPEGESITEPRASFSKEIDPPIILAQHDLTPSQTTYLIAIRALVSQGIKTTRVCATLAYKLFARSEQLNHVLDVSTLAKLIFALSGHGVPWRTGLEHVWSVYQIEMQHNKVGTTNSFTETQVVNSMIHAYRRVNSQADRAKAERRIVALAELRRTVQDTKGEIDTADIRLAAALQQGQVREAHQIAMSMKREKRRPTRENQLLLCRALFEQRDVLEFHPRFEALFQYMNYRERADPHPQIVEMRIEINVRFHMALLQASGLNGASQYPRIYTTSHSQTASLLEPLLVAIRTYQWADPQWVFHKLTYYHLLYAFSQVIQHRDALLQGTPYDARSLAVLQQTVNALADVKVHEQEHTAKNTTSFVKFPVDLPLITAHCLDLDMSGLTRQLIRSFHFSRSTPPPVAYTLAFHTLIPTMTQPSEITACLELLDEFLFYSNEPEYIAQTTFTSSDAVQAKIDTFENPQNLPFPPFGHPLAGHFASLMRLPNFIRIYRTNIAESKHKSRACKVAAASKGPHQRLPPADGAESLKDFEFLLQNFKRKSTVPQLLQRVNANGDARSPTYHVPQTVSMATRLSILPTFLQIFHLLDSRLPDLQAARDIDFQPPMTNPRASAPFLTQECSDQLITGLVDMARNYGVLGELLRGGEVSDCVLSVLLYCPQTRDIGEALFNEYRAKLRESEAAAKNPFRSALARLQYRPMLRYLAFNNRRAEYDDIMSELDELRCLHHHAFGLPHIFRGELMMATLNGDLTKVVTLLAKLRVTHYEATRQRSFFLMTIEAFDRLEDLPSLDELVNVPDYSRIIDSQPVILQLLARAFIRVEGFVAPHSSHPHHHQSHTTNLLSIPSQQRSIARGINLIFTRWTNVNDQHLPFFMHLLKCALLVGDRPSVARMVQLISKNGTHFDIGTLADDAPPLIYTYPTSSFWQSCSVPYPAFFFQPANYNSVRDGPFIASNVTITHPTAQQLLTEFLPMLSALASTGAIESVMNRLAELHYRVEESDHALKRLHLTPNQDAADQLRTAEEQCVDAVVKQLTKSAIIKFEA